MSVQDPTHSRDPRHTPPAPVQVRRTSRVRAARARELEAGTVAGTVADRGRAASLDQPDGRPLGPYEMRYDISHGYGTERRIITP